jgi:hypothetical protein
VAGSRGSLPEYPSGRIDAVIGAVAIAVVIVIAIPVGVFLAGAVMAAALGTTLKEDGEDRNEGSELLDLNT